MSFSKTNLEVLVNREIILADRTFDYCSQHFSQVFQIYNFINIYVGFLKKRRCLYRKCAMNIDDIIYRGENTGYQGP